MKRSTLIALLVGFVIAPMAYVMAHCEVPCGVYDDDARFQQMLEDQTTIAKSLDNIGKLSASQDATDRNQLSRWVAAKETHATKTQHIIAQYFMTQRIKPDGEKYVEKLTAAHAVMIAAMKCKQSADPATAVVLESSIRAFQKAYKGHAHAAHGHEHHR